MVPAVAVLVVVSIAASIRATANVTPLRTHTVVPVFPGDTHDLARYATVRNRPELCAVTSSPIPIAVTVDVPIRPYSVGVVLTN